MATGYTKTAVIKTADGDVTLTGGRAYALARQLDDNGDLLHFTNPDNEAQVDYYKVNGDSCTFCLVATVTSGTKEVEDINTVDELACPTYKYTAVAPAEGANPAEEGWYEQDGENYVLTTDTEVTESKTYYIRTEA